MISIQRDFCFIYQRPCVSSVSLSSNIRLNLQLSASAKRRATLALYIPMPRDQSLIEKEDGHECR